MEKVTRDSLAGTVTVQLDEPLELGKKIVKAVTLRATAKGGDLMAMDLAKGEVEKTMRLIGSLAQHSPTAPTISIAILSAMNASDYLALAAEAGKAMRPPSDAEDAPEGATEGEQSPAIG